MRPPTITADDTERDFAAFMTAFSEDVVHGADDPGPAIDRYYVPDFELYTDGLRLDRDKLIAHIGPVRRNGAGDFRYEVHEAMLCGSRLAARFTLHATLTRKNRTVRTQVYLFAALAPDGRLARVHQLTRILPDDPGEPDLGAAARDHAQQRETGAASSGSRPNHARAHPPR